MTFDEFKSAVDLLVAAEGELPIMLLSGGEPTLHPQFSSFATTCCVVHTGQIKRLLISTHGRKIAQNRAFAEKFEEAAAASLQFDTLRAGVYPRRVVSS